MAVVVKPAPTIGFFSFTPNERPVVRSVPVVKAVTSNVTTRKAKR